MENLIPMVDFVPENPYSKFLKKPVEKWMFVPCDENGDVLEEPNEEFELSYWDYSTKSSKYQQAKERCLFEGFELDFNNMYIIKVSNVVFQILFYKNGCVTINAKNIKTIEDLIPYNLKLTATAKKEIGL